MKMTGNTVLITGGTSGIGLELALQLMKLGNQVIVTGREQEKIDSLPKENPGLITVKSDVSESAAIAQLHERVIRDYSGLKLLSRVAPGLALRMTSSSVDEMLAQTQH